MPDWSSYFARIEGAPVSIAVDLDLRESAPLAGKATAYTVAVALRDPDEHGMPGAREFATLAELEEALCLRLAELGALEVGRITGRSLRTFHFYGPACEQVAPVVAGVLAAYAPYEFKVLAAEDPQWSIYTGYLYPDRDQLAFARDMKTLQALREAGDDFARERDVEHVVRFAQSQQAEGFADAVAGRGFGVRAGGGTVVVTQRTAIDPFAIAAARIAVTTLAQEFGGTYEGWSCEPGRKG